MAGEHDEAGCPEIDADLDASSPSPAALSTDAIATLSTDAPAALSTGQIDSLTGIPS